MKRFLKNCTIRKKMVVSHGTIALLAVLVTLVGLLGINSLINRLEDMHNGPVVSTAAIGDVLYYSSDIKGGITGILTQRSNAYFDSFNEMMEADAQTISTAITTLKESLSYTNSAQAQQLTQTLEQTFTAGESVRRQIMDAMRKGDFDRATTLYGMDYRVTIQDIQTAATELKGIVDEGTTAYYDLCLRQSNAIVAVVLLMSVICLVLGYALTHIVSSLIRVPVTQIMEASKEMLQGNLSVADTITYQSNDELGQLAQSMRETLRLLHSYIAEISQTLDAVANGDLTMNPGKITEFRGDFASIKHSLSYILNNLNDTLSEINLASEQVNNGAAYISSGAQTLAQGASEQNSSVERLSIAVTDITNQINVTAQHSDTAMQTMQATAQQVQECNEQMNHMVDAMSDITQQASQIEKIVKTIEDIAFQTNILALNAAVEAARAGAAGKGFAVVADEVRSLAAKSADASQSTSDLIGGTVKAVNNGTKVLSETAQTLLHVVEGSRASAALVDEIAQAANAQADAVSEISQNIDQIAMVVHTTSSTAEQSASASEELSGQVATLNQLVKHFRLRGKL